jgi:hypothetical protein
MTKTKKKAGKPVAVLKAEKGPGKRASSAAAAGPKLKKKKIQKKIVPIPKVIEEEEDSDVEEEVDSGFFLHLFLIVFYFLQMTWSLVEPIVTCNSGVWIDVISKFRTIQPCWAFEAESTFVCTCSLSFNQRV